MERVDILGIEEIQQMFGVGRRLAQRYATESGALLPRVKNGEWKIRKDKFLDYMNGGAQ